MNEQLIWDGVPLIDPMGFKRVFWPQITFYDKQIETIYAIPECLETFVPAANKMGKDFVTGFIVLWFFVAALKAGKTCRILTTSVKDEHLDVLWGEIGRWMTTSEVPLMSTQQNL